MSLFYPEDVDVTVGFVCSEHPSEFKNCSYWIVCSCVYLFWHLSLFDIESKNENFWDCSLLGDFMAYIHILLSG
jgi:hypothetical protein